MPVINRFAEMQDEIAAWRRDFHRHPELGFDTHRTARIVAEKLGEFGVDEVVTGIGRTGVVGIIRGQGDGGVIGLRADMDALPIEEKSGVPHASAFPGKMHACGHDGHTAMLLGAAKYLAETRNFAGTVAVIFQPAEEGGGGGREMVEDGMMERFGIDRVFGLHNSPGRPLGSFATRPGPLMAAADFLTIRITGKGGHAARPHVGADTNLAAAHVLVALQAIVSRGTDPVDQLVISVTTIRSDTVSFNVLPGSVEMLGTVRSLKGDVRDMAEAAIARVATATAAAFGCTADVDYQRNYPVTENDAGAAAFASEVARQVAGAAAVEDDTVPVMAGEDFSFMLNARPGAFMFLGQGDTAPLHNAAYDFNDAIIPAGCSYWVTLAETALKRAG